MRLAQSSVVIGGRSFRATQQGTVVQIGNYVAPVRQYFRVRSRKGWIRQARLHPLTYHFAVSQAA